MLRGQPGVITLIRRPRGVHLTDNGVIMVESNASEPVPLVKLLEEELAQCDGITQLPAFLWDLPDHGLFVQGNRVTSRDYHRFLEKNRRELKVQVELEDRTMTLMYFGGTFLM